MNRITENLYISDALSVGGLGSNHDFDEIVSLGYVDAFSQSVPKQSTTGDKYVFPDGPHEYSVFKNAVDYVRAKLESNDTVLVHCQAGVSRSVGVCSAALAQHENISLNQAFERVSASRAVANPSPEIQNSMERYTGTSLSYDPTSK